MMPLLLVEIISRQRLIGNDQLSRFERIEAKIKAEFDDWEFFSLIDESHQHAGRKGMESHFKLLLVSDSFSGQGRVQRHRKVQDLLEEEFSQGLHALTLRLLTSKEYSPQTENEFQSPQCRGSKN